MEERSCRWVAPNGDCMQDGCKCDGGCDLYEPKTYPVARVMR